MAKQEIVVLVVEDDKTIAKTMGEALTRAGFKPVVTHRAEDALNAIKIRHAHAAIVDCMLPATNGLTLVKELRATSFGENPVILVSGIFKDKAFEQDAIRKTGAIAYLEKPFGPLDLLAVLKPATESLRKDAEWTLKTILTKKLTSVRERVKLVEHLEEIKGIEIAFVVSILMDARVSGFLNLVAGGGQIFGVTLKKGTITNVDSESADQASIRYLTDTGYLSESDWKEFQESQNVRNPLTKLVNAGLISPHAATEAKKDQMRWNLIEIMRMEEISINFVPDQSTDLPGEFLDIVDLFADLQSTADQMLTLTYLREFFEDHLQTNVTLADDTNAQHLVWDFGMVERVKDLIHTVNGGSLESAIHDNPASELNLLKAFYCLVIFRQVLFIDDTQVRHMERELGRRSKMVDDLKGAGPFAVFVYFGCSPECRVADVERRFREFVKENHPDKLATDATSELREVTTELFSIVSAAYTTLVDARKREQFQKQMQTEQANKQLGAESQAQDALECLRRGQFSKAETLLRTALESLPSVAIYSLHVWARVKSKGRGLPKADLFEMQKHLESYSNQERSTPYYHMALGLIRGLLGEPNAINSFEKALSLDPSFGEARREINALQSAASANSSPDLLNGDLTQFVSQLFRRKIK